MSRIAIAAAAVAGLIIVYAAAFAYKLDDVDRESARKALVCLSWGMQHGFPHNNSHVRQTVARLLLTPFKPAGWFQYVTKGKYTSIPDDVEAFKQFRHKMYWHELFQRNGIRTPKLFETCDYGDRVRHESQTSDNVIVKPMLGTQGAGIRRVATCGEEECMHKDEWMCQEGFWSCGREVPEHYRVVTMWDGSVFLVWRLVASKKSVASNLSAGATAELVADDAESMMRMPLLLHRACEQLARAHAAELPDQVSIGWDVLTSCQGGRVVSAVALEGNATHAWVFPSRGMPLTTGSWHDRAIRKYKSMYRVWRSAL